jgi:twitching motility protein PilT
MQTGRPFGMTTFDDHIVNLYEQGLVTQDTALAYASHKGVAGRGIDSVKSARGEATSDIENLEIDRAWDKA